MSVLDDAKAMAKDCPGMTDRGGRGECYYCSGSNYEGDYTSHTPTSAAFRHEPNCPWLSMPKIVTALEAIEDVQRQLVFLDHPHVRTDPLAVLWLADHVREMLATESA
jgi:hypothetical protein